MIQSVATFADYFESIRRRTLNYARVIPPDRFEWQPKPDEFTCGEILRHLAATEKMYIRVFTEGIWNYAGHQRGTLNTLDENIAYLEKIHLEAMEKLRAASDDLLKVPRVGVLPDSPPVKAWRWLMAMVEHEVHHRSQLASYLTLMGVEPPQIYGVKVEELMALSGE